MMNGEKDKSGNVPRLALRPKEAAAALGIGERKLYELTKAGEIPHVRLGGRILYPVGLLTRWLEAWAVGPAVEGAEEICPINGNDVALRQ